MKSWCIMTWNKIVTTPNRWMAYYLRRRGWVCFYLDERARFCPSNAHKLDWQGRYISHGCWLALYQDEETRGQ